MEKNLHFILAAGALIGLFALNSPISPNAELGRLESTQDSTAFGEDGSARTPTPSPQVAQFLDSLNGGKGVASTPEELAMFQKYDKTKKSQAYVATLRSRQSITMAMTKKVRLESTSNATYADWNEIAVDFNSALTNAKNAAELHPTAANRELYAYAANFQSETAGKSINPKYKAKPDPKNPQQPEKMY